MQNDGRHRRDHEKTEAHQLRERHIRGHEHGDKGRQRDPEEGSYEENYQICVEEEEDEEKNAKGASQHEPDGMSSNDEEMSITPTVLPVIGRTRKATHIPNLLQVPRSKR